MNIFDVDSLIVTVRNSTNKRSLIWEVERLKHYLERNAAHDVRDYTLSLLDKTITLLSSDQSLFSTQNDIISYLEEVKELLTESSSQDPSLSLCDVVILTVTDVEYSAFQKINSYEWITCQFNNIITSNFSGLKMKETVKNGIKIILIKQMQMGMVEAAVITEKVMLNLRPKIIVSCGIAASIKPDNVKIHDVIVVSECWDYGSGKLEGSAIDTTTFFHSANHAIAGGIINRIIDQEIEINSKINSWKNEFSRADFSRENSKLFIGKMVSGASVIKNKTVRDIICSESRDVLALDMETYGFYYTVQRRNKINKLPIDFITVKAIVDYADSEKNDNHQELSAYLSARTTLYVIENYNFS